MAFIALGSSFFIAATFVGCDGDETAVNPEPDAASPTVSLTFEGKVGSDVFRCSRSYPNLGTTRATVELVDFRLYVHDIRLVRRDGVEVPLALAQDGKWQYRNVALLDFEDRSGSCINGTVDTNTTITGTVPRGDYTGLRFRLGLPFDLNHGNAAAAPSPLNLSGLFWSWNGGYKFVRADARVVTGDAGDAGMHDDAGSHDTGHEDAGHEDAGGGHGAPGTFFIHLGSTGCQGDARDGGISGCDRRNVPDIELASFDFATNKIVVDYAALVAGSEFTPESQGCMSSASVPACAPLFTRFGLDLVSGRPAAGQALFRVE